MNWKFWKKKIPVCFGYYNATVLSREAYLEQKCCLCEDKIMMRCFLKSQKPISMILEDVGDLEAWK